MSSVFDQWQGAKQSRKADRLRIVGNPGAVCLRIRADHLLLLGQ